MKKTLIIATIVLLCLAAVMLTGCIGAKKYQVDYSGGKALYRHARDSYRAGSTVTLYFDLIATDTDYSFLLDGEYLNFTYDQKKGFIIQFTMPNHDVTLECKTTNSMEFIK